MDEYLTRCTLLIRAKDQNDHEAWQELIHAYHRYIYVIVRSMNISSSQADDICQQVLVKLWQSLPNYEHRPGESKFRYWLARVTRNKVIDFMRKEKSYREKLDKAGANSLIQSEFDEPEIERIATQEWQTFLANMAMKNIEANFSAAAIQAFKMHSKGQETKSIAAELDVKADSVYKYISRIKVKLIDEIKQLQHTLDI